LAEVRKGAAPTDVWPHKYSNLPSSISFAATSEKLTSTEGKWKLVKLKVPAQADPDNEDELWVRLTVGRDGETFTAYVDDIRFRPVKSLVTTTYYDTKWQQPIISVDANNNPGQKVEYDDFGRPVAWYKVDKTNPAVKTLLQSKEYHLMSDWYKPDPTKWYKIVSAINENYCIDIKDRVWADGQPIHLWAIQTSNDDNQKWKFVSTGDGYYNIVSRGAGENTFRIDDPFGNVTDGTPLKITSANDNNQKWKMTDAGGGYCHIAAKADNTALIDVKDGNTGTDNILQIYKNGMNSKWKMVELAP
jgi:hypothetical protein